jgi:hypothetical protein
VTSSTNPNLKFSGYSSFPNDYKSDPKLDGIIYDYNYLPGVSGRAPGFDSGVNMAHEIGHWVGLYHTFQGVSFTYYFSFCLILVLTSFQGCVNPGDYVDDTPPEASPAADNGDCPIGRDTCPGGGVDPIRKC